MPNLFSQMTTADAAVFATYVKPVTFAADTVIFRQGDEPNACYLVETGRVRIELSGDHVDSDNVLGYVSAGSVFGELALLDGQPRSATAVAQTEVVTRQLKATDLTALAAAHPLVAAATKDSATGHSCTRVTRRETEAAAAAASATS